MIDDQPGVSPPPLRAVPAGHVLGEEPAPLELEVAADPARSRLLVPAGVSAAEVAAALAGLAPPARARTELVPLAPGQGSGRALAAEVARRLGEPVWLVNGVPLATGVFALDDAGRPAWREPAWRLRFQPDGAEEVLGSAPPHPSLRPLDPATFAMDHGWRVRLTGGGLHAAPPGRDEPELGDGAYRVVIGAAGEEIADELWPPLSALFTALLTDIPSRVELVVLGTPSAWGAAAARELAQRHQGPPAAAPPPTPPEPPPAGSERRPRRRLALAAVVVALLLLAGVGTAAAWPDGPAAETETATGTAGDRFGGDGSAGSPGVSGAPRPSGSRSGSPSASASRRPSASATPSATGPGGAVSAPGPAEAATTQPATAGLAGPANLAAGRTATESSHADVYAARNATDGDADTYWESRNGAFPQWLQVDLGTAADVRRAVLRLPPSAAWPSRTQRIEIQAGPADTALSTVVGPATYTFDAAGAQRVTIALPAGAPRRYVRFVFTANSVQPAGQLSAVELYTS